MKRLIYKITTLALILVLMNWIYNRFMFKSDLKKFSDEIELSWKVAEDNCQIVYTGESSNHTSAPYDNDKRWISDYISDYFPMMKCGNMTKNASHGEVYYHLLNNIPENAAVETVIVTMNLRSFGYDWIESNLETAIQKQLVLLKDNPPLFNRFLLAFKAYDIKSDSERNEIRAYHRRNDKLVFPYPFKYDNVADWDYAKACQKVIDNDGNRNQRLTELACHYIKGFAFIIDEENPRINDFDNIVALAEKRGWNLVFNLMAENVDRINELVGSDLIFLMKQNRDYLINRYEPLDNVTVVDNLDDLRNDMFIDKHWISEHYCEMGRRTIANNVAQAVRQYHPDMYVDVDDIKCPKNHYRISLASDSINICPSNYYKMLIEDKTSEIENDAEKVYISGKIWREQLSENHEIVMELYKNNIEIQHNKISVNDFVQTTNKWDFFTTVLPIDSTFFDADSFKIFLHNDSESQVYIKTLDVSFEYDKYARKGKQ